MVKTRNGLTGLAILGTAFWAVEGFAQVRTSTGHFWPTSAGAETGGYAGWLASGCNGATNYTSGYYHIARDIQASLDSPVYAVADGVVLSISSNGWGDGNVGLLIRHSLADGTMFVAVYGHVHSSLAVGSRVTAGRQIATIGPYSTGTHVHLGIRPGRAIPPSPWGRMPCSAWPGTNGFANPGPWLTQRTPANGRDGRGIADMHDRAVADGRFPTVIPGTFGRDLTSDQSWEQRWLGFNYNGRTAWLLHATAKSNPANRWTTFWDPWTQRWSTWQQATP